MKTVIYITRNKVWANEVEYAWNGANLVDVFEKIKRDLRISQARVVLGNEISYVTSMQFMGPILNREAVLKMMRVWLPFQINNECFDWKEVSLVPGERWLQIVVMEKSILESLSTAVKRSGIKVDLVTAIGVVLAQKTVGREVPVILRWIGKEKLMMVSVNGLADLIASDIGEDELMIYAKQKWGLAVNPEEIAFMDEEVNIAEIVYAERVKGDDRLVLNLPILEETIDIGGGNTEEIVVEEKNIIGEEKKKNSYFWIYGVIPLVLILGGGVVSYKTGLLKKGLFQTSQQITPAVTVSPTVTEIPTPQVVDWSAYTVQVLNGSGVTGEAAKIKTLLFGTGFVNVDTGNTTATNSSNIRTKEAVPSTVEEKVINEITDYKVADGTVLANDGKYDLVIVLGKH